MSTPVSIGGIVAGKYRVERVIGTGGMGVVVAAKHLQLDERVAIKFLQPDASLDDELIRRFLREGRAAAKMRSEHVARIYDVGALEGGVPYIIMEYLEGSDLAAVIERRGPLPEEVAAEYVLQACEAIAEAHALGIVHRDIKPANLFLSTRRDGSPSVKLIDFGIAKVDVMDEAGMKLTKTTEMRGSVLFMSPEQMTSPHDVDSRSDIWSLGVTLHYLLTGVYPFKAPTGPALCAMILTREPAPLRAARPETSPDLEALVLRCLRKDPSERFASVAELAAALAPFAPPDARFLAMRSARMLGAPRLSEPASGPAPGPASTSQLAGAERTGGGSALPQPGPASTLAPGKAERPDRVTAPPDSASSPPPSKSSWASTRRPIPRAPGARTKLVVAGVALSGVALVLLSTGADRRDAPALVVAASGAQVPGALTEAAAAAGRGASELSALAEARVGSSPTGAAAPADVPKAPNSGAAGSGGTPSASPAEKDGLKAEAADTKASPAGRAVSGAAVSWRKKRGWEEFGQPQ